MADRFEIAGRRVGPDEPPYVIAEAGVHHGNDVELAAAYIRSAAEADADAIKFQTYRADRLAARWAPTYWDSGDGRTQHDIFAERSLLERSDYERLFAIAREAGIELLSTPFDPDAAAMLADLGMAAFKVASADLTNRPLLEAVAGYRRPVLLSTGASTFDEVSAAVELIAAAGAPVALLHCSLAYPTPLADANLRRIGELGRRFPSVVLGYSDHTQPADSELACPLAVALGARVIEKHYTHDRSLPDDDHYHAVDPDGLARLVDGCRQAFAMASTFAEVTPAEERARAFARRSIVAARDLPAGHRIGPDDVDCKRPGTGLSPMRIEEVVGRRTARPFAADELIELDGLE